MGGIVEKIIPAVVKFAMKSGGINPWFALGASLFISWALRPKVPDTPDFGTTELDNFEKGLLINKQSNDANLPIIYGERLVGGTRVFLETSGNDNTYMYMAIAMGEGEINSIEQILINDNVVTWDASIADNTQINVGSGDANFYKDSTSLITVEPHFGTDGQSASSLLSTLTNWTSNHKLSGVSYLALRFKYNKDVWGTIPKVQAKIKGRKVVTYNSSLVAQTASYSTNPSWCLLDYLTNARYGKGLTTSEIDLQSFYDSSLICVTQVTPYSGSGSDINIFDCNTAVDTSRSIIDNVRDLIKGCRGYMPYTAGKYSLIIEATGTATVTLNEDDIVGGYDLSIPDKNSKYNRVIASYINPDRNWQVDEVQFPPIDDSGLDSGDQHATMKASDGGVLLEGRFTFPTLTSKYQAEEMAEIILRRSRDALTLNINVSFKGYELAIGDIVNVTYSSLGFSAKPFRVLGITFNSDYSVGLSLVEHQDSHYTWASKVVVDTVPTTNLPNPYSVLAPASVTLSDQLIAYNDGTVIVAMDVLIGASTDQFVDYYQVEYKLNTDSDYQVHSTGTGLNRRVLNVIDQEIYDVKVKAVNGLGVSSSYTSASRTIIGGIAPPSNVSEFVCNIVGQEAHLSWEAVADLDLAYYEIRFTTDLSNPEWINSVALVKKVSRPATSITVPARVGSYLIKAVDKLGNFSISASTITTNILSIGNYNSITTVTESPTFSGTKTNTIVTDGILKLTDTEIFDSASGNFDDETTNFFDSGVILSDLNLTGSYAFTDTIDIGAKVTARITASITQSVEDLANLFDSETGLFDDASSGFDGDAASQASSNLEISISDDNITFSNFNSFVIADYSARYFKFRLKLTSGGAANPLISALAVSIDMEDRIQSSNDITSGAGVYSIVFGVPYYATNYAVGITAQGMATGDYFLVTNKSSTGFDVAFKNAGGTGISKSFDYLAKGY